MPQITLSFADHAAVPDALKPFANGGAAVTIWAGDKVAEETNPRLAANRDAFRGEKEAAETKYANLLATVSPLNTEVMELRQKVAQGSSATPEDLAVVAAVRKHLPTIKAADLDKKLETVPTLESRVATFEARERNATLFKASGFKDETVFMDLLGNKDKNVNLEEAIVETETVTENGETKTVQKLVAKVKDASGTVTKMPFADYVKANEGWKPYMPVLEGSGVASETSWLPQPPSGGSESGQQGGFDLDKYIEEKNKKTQTGNSLFPSQAAAAPSGVNANVPQN